MKNAKRLICVILLASAILFALNCTAYADDDKEYRIESVDFDIVFAADTMAMLVSCIVRNETAAMTVMPFVLIIQLVMFGTIFELKGASAVIADLTVSRWGMAELMSISRTNAIVDVESEFAGILYGANPTATALALNWARLLVFCVVFLALSVLALSQVDKDKR